MNSIAPQSILKSQGVSEHRIVQAWRTLVRDLSYRLQCAKNAFLISIQDHQNFMEICRYYKPLQPAATRDLPIAILYNLKNSSLFYIREKKTHVIFNDKGINLQDDLSINECTFEMDDYGLFWVVTQEDRNGPFVSDQIIKTHNQSYLLKILPGEIGNA